MSSTTPQANPTVVTTGDIQPTNKHALTAVERQRAQLAKLLKDPSKPAFIPPPPKEKNIRPPREMMKNVQGSSAGAGSGEFHVYKANRRREYERLKMMEDQKEKEREKAEWEHKHQEREELAEAKAAKNRAKRMKKKERAKSKGKGAEQRPSESNTTPNSNVSPGSTNQPFKKRRLVNGAEIKFQRPRENDDIDREDEADEDGARERVDNDADNDDESDNADIGPYPPEAANSTPISVVEQKIVIYDSD